MLTEERVREVERHHSNQYYRPGSITETILFLCAEWRNRQATSSLEARIDKIEKVLGVSQTQA
jgi:hypothetical protein